MADHVAAGDDIFVYTGGQAPQHVVNAIIDESVKEMMMTHSLIIPICSLWSVTMEF